MTGAWIQHAGTVLLLLSVSCSTPGPQHASLPPPVTADKVDLSRYTGLWFEIASYPQWFQRNCTQTTAEYSLREDGLIQVTNRCNKRHPGGRAIRARGVARPTGSVNAKLEVSFLRPFWGPYWIIILDPGYQYAVVSTPGRNSLWVLSRTPRMDSALYQSLLDELAARGFSLSRLKKTVQQVSSHGS